MNDATKTGTASTDAGVTQTADPGTAGTTSTTLTAETPPAADAPKDAPAADTPKPDAADDGAKPADAPKEGEKPPEDAKDDKPVDYKFDLPDDVKVDEGRLKDFTDIAKDLKLPADAAQKIVDLAVKQQQAMVEAHAEQVKSWGDAVANDKELGKPENQAVARQAVEAFGSKGLKDLLNTTGLGNHPEVVRAFLKVGRAISEDKVIVGRGDAPVPKDPASVLYPNQAKS